MHTAPPGPYTVIRSPPAGSCSGRQWALGHAQSNSDGYLQVFLREYLCVVWGDVTITRHEPGVGCTPPPFTQT